MGINEEGIEAERKGRLFLKNKGLHNIQQIDWLFKNDNGRYYAVEVKHRELFEPPPFLGTGLDIRQLKLRKQLLMDLNIDTYLIVFVGNIVYWNLLSRLESDKHFDTRNRIRIYPIKNFKSQEWATNIRTKDIHTRGILEYNNGPS